MREYEYFQIDQPKRVTFSSIFIKLISAVLFMVAFYGITAA